MRGVYTFTTESIIFHQTSLPPSLTAPPCVYLSFLYVAPPSLSRLPHAVQRASYHRGPAVSIWWRHWWGKPRGGWRGKRPSAKNTAFHTHTHTCARTHTPLPNRLLQPAAEATPEWIPVSPFFFFFFLHRLQQMCSAEAAGARKSRENRAEHGGGRGVFRSHWSTLISRCINLLSV